MKIAIDENLKTFVAIDENLKTFVGRSLLLRAIGAIASFFAAFRVLLSFRVDWDRPSRTPHSSTLGLDPRS
jgi:hypothetical protein